MTLGEAGRFASLSPRRIRSLLNVTLIACWMGLVQLKSIGQPGLLAVKLQKSRVSMARSISSSNAIVSFKMQLRLFAQLGAHGMDNEQLLEWKCKDVIHIYIYTHHIPSCIRLPEKSPQFCHNEQACCF